MRNNNRDRATRSRAPQNARARLFHLVESIVDNIDEDRIEVDFAAYLETLVDRCRLCDGQKAVRLRSGERFPRTSERAKGGFEPSSMTTTTVRGLRRGDVADSYPPQLQIPPDVTERVTPGISPGFLDRQTRGGRLYRVVGYVYRVNMISRENGRGFPLRDF